MASHRSLQPEVAAPHTKLPPCAFVTDRSAATWVGDARTRKPICKADPCNRRACSLGAVCLHNGTFVRRGRTERNELYTFASASADVRLTRRLEVLPGRFPDAVEVMTRPLAIVGGPDGGRFGIDNVYHFMDEALHPMWLAMNSTPALNWTVIPVRPSSFSTRRFDYLFGLLPGADVLLHFDGVSRPTSRSQTPYSPPPLLISRTPLSLLPLPPPPPPLSRWHCFDELVHDAPRTAPISPDYYKGLARTSGVCAPPPSAGEFRVLLVQRLANRRIVNVQPLLAALRRMNGRARLPHGFASVRVALVSWERLTLEQQMATVCEHHIMVAAHGAGNQWSLFLDGARPDRMAALLELALADWGNCQYARSFARRGYASECQSHPRAHPARLDFWAGIKPDDLIVQVENVTRGVQRLMEKLHATQVTNGL